MFRLTCEKHEKILVLRRIVYLRLFAWPAETRLIAYLRSFGWPAVIGCYWVLLDGLLIVPRNRAKRFNRATQSCHWGIVFIWGLSVDLRLFAANLFRSLPISFFGLYILFLSPCAIPFTEHFVVCLFVSLEIELSLFLFHFVLFACLDKIHRLANCESSLYSTLIREISTPPSISQQRLMKAECKEVDAAGFEPALERF